MTSSERARRLVALGAALALVLLAVVAVAAFTLFSWTASVVDPTHDAALSYTVKCGNATGGPYPIAGTVPAPATSIPFASVIKAPGTYFCVVTASNASGDSGPSNEITFRFAPPNAPTGLTGP